MAEYVIAPRLVSQRSLVLGRQIALCIVEARPVVLLIYLLRLAAGYALARPVADPEPASRILLAALTWLLATVSVYLFDGVMDMAEDRLNGSTRPIARGDLPQPVALAVSIGCAGLAVAGALHLGRPYVVLVPVLILLGYAYAAPPLRLKRWSGATGATVLIAGLMTFVAGAAAGGGSAISTRLTVFAIAMSCWMGLVGALAKDFTDVYGDALVGRRTCAVVHGIRGAAIRLSVNAVGVGVGFLVVARFVAPILLWPAVVVTLGAVLVVSGSARPAQGKPNRSPYRAFMATQYAAHLVVLPAVLLS
jgi:4-hydroxybenzoate polyprenyltransferase